MFPARCDISDVRWAAVLSNTASPGHWFLALTFSEANRGQRRLRPGRYELDLQVREGRGDIRRRQGQRRDTSEEGCANPETFGPRSCQLFLEGFGELTLKGEEATRKQGPWPATPVGSTANDSLRPACRFHVILHRGRARLLGAGWGTTPSFVRGGDRGAESRCLPETSACPSQTTVHLLRSALCPGKLPVDAGSGTLVSSGFWLDWALGTRWAESVGWRKERACAFRPELPFCGVTADLWSLTRGHGSGWAALWAQPSLPRFRPALGCVPNTPPTSLQRGSSLNSPRDGTGVRRALWFLPGS